MPIINTGWNPAKAPIVAVPVSIKQLPATPKR